MAGFYEVVSDAVRSASDAPRGADLFYRRRTCEQVIPSQPDDNVGCDCGNIFIDDDHHRLAVRDFGAFEVVRRRSAE